MPNSEVDTVRTLLATRTLGAALFENTREFVAAAKNAYDHSRVPDESPEWTEKDHELGGIRSYTRNRCTQAIGDVEEYLASADNIGRLPQEIRILLEQLATSARALRDEVNERDRPDGVAAFQQQRDNLIRQIDDAIVATLEN